MKTIKKPTADLQPGDKVVWGDGSFENIDTVISVENMGQTLRVNVRRFAGKTFFYAGYKSVQNVKEE